VEDLIINIDQPMFLAAVLSALEQPHLRDLHHHWTGGTTFLNSPNPDLKEPVNVWTDWIHESGTIGKVFKKSSAAIGFLFLKFNSEYLKRLQSS
jgi:hypothetical protein